MQPCCSCSLRGASRGVRVCARVLPSFIPPPPPLLSLSPKHLSPVFSSHSRAGAKRWENKGLFPFLSLSLMGGLQRAWPRARVCARACAGCCAAVLCGAGRVCKQRLCLGRRAAGGVCARARVCRTPLGVWGGTPGLGRARPLHPLPPPTRPRPPPSPPPQKQTNDVSILHNTQYSHPSPTASGGGARRGGGRWSGRAPAPPPGRATPRAPGL